MFFNKNIDTEMIEKVCRLWYNNCIEKNKTTKEAMLDAFNIYKQITMIFKDNKEEQDYALYYFCNVLLKGDINESDSNQRQS